MMKNKVVLVVEVYWISVFVSYDGGDRTRTSQMLQSKLPSQVVGARDRRWCLFEKEEKILIKINEKSTMVQYGIAC